MRKRLLLVCLTGPIRPVLLLLAVGLVAAVAVEVVAAGLFVLETSTASVATLIVLPLPPPAVVPAAAASLSASPCSAAAEFVRAPAVAPPLTPEVTVAFARLRPRCKLVGVSARLPRAPALVGVLVRLEGLEPNASLLAGEIPLGDFARVLLLLLLLLLLLMPDALASEVLVVAPNAGLPAGESALGDFARILALLLAVDPSWDILLVVPASTPLPAAPTVLLILGLAPLLTPAESLALLLLTRSRELPLLNEPVDCWNGDPLAPAGTEERATAGEVGDRILFALDNGLRILEAVTPPATAFAATAPPLPPPLRAVLAGLVTVELLLLTTLLLLLLPPPPSLLPKLFCCWDTFIEAPR